ncbi:MAG: hypothetical protein J7L34_01430 [Thermotogaceae bacterium]|nr:hypothetical protein [Thermotogaceae bacterium]
MRNKKATLIFAIFLLFVLYSIVHLLLFPGGKNFTDEWLYSYPPKRGNIVDSKGKPLATDNYVFKAYLDLKFLKSVLSKSQDEQKDEVLRQLRILRDNFAVETPTSSILNYHNRFLFLGEFKEKDEIIDRVPPGFLPFVSIEVTTKRSKTFEYSLNTILGSVIDGKGVGGVESFFNEKLEGKKVGKIAVAMARFPRMIPILKEIIPPVNGENVTLSIDYDMQRMLYLEILRKVAETMADAGGAIIMETKTGKIKAMVTTRDWNANTMGIIEPGSSIKPLIYAIALETKAATEDFEHHCTGKIKPIKNLDIYIGDSKAHGDVDFREALIVSCNTATVKIAELLKQKIGEKGMYEWLEKFGFGKKTGIEISGEIEGLFRNYKRWSSIDFAEISIGQGIGVTPVQLIAAVNTIFNGGIYVRPSVIKDSKKVEKRILSRKVAYEIRSILKEVVERGTGELAKVPGVKLAGKTGTAQKAQEGMYDKKSYYSIFIGAFPADDPKYTILVYIDNPKSGEYLGGEVAAPVFANIVRDLLKMKEPSPLIIYKGVVPNLIGLSLKDILYIKEHFGFDIKIHGTGVVAIQKPEPGSLNPNLIEVWLKEP